MAFHKGGRKVGKLMHGGVSRKFLIRGGRQVFPGKRFPLPNLEYRFQKVGGDTFFEVGFRSAEVLEGSATEGWMDARGQVRLDLAWTKDLANWFYGFFLPAGEPEEQEDGSWIYWSRSRFPRESDSSVSHLSVVHAEPDARDNPITEVMINGAVVSLGYPFTLPADAARMQTELRAAGFLGALVEAFGDSGGWLMSIPSTVTSSGQANKISWPMYEVPDPIFGVMTQISGLTLGGAFYNADGVATNLPKQFVRMRVARAAMERPANPAGADYGQFFESSLISSPSRPFNPDAPIQPPLVPSAEMVAFAAMLSAEVDTRLAGKTPSAATRHVFSAKSPDVPSYTRNATLWGADWAQQLTGIAARYNMGGWGEAFGGVMITRRHYLQCSHAHFSWDHFLLAGQPLILRFVELDGTVVDRQVIGDMQVAGNDLHVGLLNEEVPPSIHVFPLCPALTPLQRELFQKLLVPDVAVSQGYGLSRPPGFQNAAGTLPLTNDQLLYPGVAFASYGSQASGSRFPWWHKPFPGDSGTPRFLTHPSGLVLSDITSGSAPYQAALVQAAIAAADAEAVGRGTLTAATGLTVTVAAVEVPAG